MKHNLYMVIFETGKKEIISAFSEAEASILAQAIQIRDGNRYDIKSIEDGLSDDAVWVARHTN